MLKVGVSCGLGNWLIVLRKYLHFEITLCKCLILNLFEVRITICSLVMSPFSQDFQVCNYLRYLQYMQICIINGSLLCVQLLGC